MTEQLFNVKEVAARLNVSCSLVYALIESGKLVAHRVGRGRGALRVSAADFEAYLAVCRSERVQPRPRRTRVKLRHIKI